MTPSLTVLDHLVLTVSDLDMACAFYTATLGMQEVVFQPASGPARRALRFGDQKINLHLAGAEFQPHAARPLPGSADLCFLSDTPLSDWQAHLTAQGVPILEGPVARSGAKGPILSLYIRDPDGTLIEIANR